MTLAAGSSVGVLSRFPTSFEELPQLHRLLLAVLAAQHDQDAATPLSWPQLVRNTVYALAEGVDIQVPAGGLARAIEASLGDLTDYGMVVSSVDGLELSERTVNARDSWNGAFKQLVAAVEDLGAQT